MAGHQLIHVYLGYYKLTDKTMTLGDHYRQVTL